MRRKDACRTIYVATDECVSMQMRPVAILIKSRKMITVTRFMIELTGGLQNMLHSTAVPQVAAVSTFAKELFAAVVEASSEVRRRELLAVSHGSGRDRFQGC